jgi:hypothetical protein
MKQWVARLLMEVGIDNWMNLFQVHFLRNELIRFRVPKLADWVETPGLFPRVSSDVRPPSTQFPVNLESLALDNFQKSQVSG